MSSPERRGVDLEIPSKEYEEEHGIDWEDYFSDTPI